MGIAEAAQLLNASRSYVVGLLLDGKIKAFGYKPSPLSIVLHLDVASVRAYRRWHDEHAGLAMAELAYQAQALGMGY